MDKHNLMMNVVHLLSTLSSDNKTHVGAVIVDPVTDTIVSAGWNDFPRGFLHKKVENKPERQERPYKYNFFLHAERMAIARAAHIGVPLATCHLYTNGIPCTGCTQSVIEAGIMKVFVDKNWKKYANMKWLEEAKISEVMFAEAGVFIEEVDTRAITPSMFVDGNHIDIVPYINRSK